MAQAFFFCFFGGLIGGSKALRLGSADIKDSQNVAVVHREMG